MNSFTTTYTTRVPCCEICDAKTFNYYENLDIEILNLSRYIKDSDGMIRDNNWHILCDKHKKEYDLKLNMKLRKEKLKKINEHYDMGS